MRTTYDVKNYFQRCSYRSIVDQWRKSTTINIALSECIAEMVALYAFDIIVNPCNLKLFKKNPSCLRTTDRNTEREIYVCKRKEQSKCLFNESNEEKPQSK